MPSDPGFENIASEAVKRVILASAPERESELAQIWEKYSPQFRLANDRRDFVLEAGCMGLVLFTSRSMSYMWLLAFAAQRALGDYADVITASRKIGRFDPSYLQQIPISSFGSVLEKIRGIADVENEDDFNWPCQIPHPSQGKPGDVEGSMAFDVVCIAAGYSFLHEVKHVQFREDGESLEPHVEEHLCDKFARKMLLDNMTQYSAISGDSEEMVLTKRAIGIALGIFLLWTIIPKDIWAGSLSHPSILSRIQRLTEDLGLPENSHFWTYFASLLIAQLVSDGQTLEAFPTSSAKAFANYLLGELLT